MQNNNDDRAVFFTQYVNTLLWSETDDNGNPLDDNYDESDIDPTGTEEMRGDCDDFIAANVADLADIDAAQAGHDFALTRNQHGAGFWDRGLGDLGDRLSDAAKVYGTQGLSAGDDGTLYVHG